MPRKKSTPDFEQSLSELESLISQMEQGDLSLEASLAAFEEGIRLTRECQQMLDDAEQKVDMLTRKEGEFKSVPFTAAQED